ncbi:uncharacterized protein CDV56_102667 [Aspergillus thermomutatus]|uniref:B30.2/SPRY domain-containing protein n=1 Tax=Aspergillus thermomutatus TaxID=41047 RepID=A0A397GNT1_ASPTH|nr:uncharacterized protein CDV56_102667 [Aspergillus thermomutatus]RHZ49640.1 hypothetical protein CDV56_102667 [Aspergillus thermomutatus]
MAEMILLSQGLDVNAKTTSEATPIIVAAARNHAEIVKILLRRGAAVNVVDHYGWTPLYGAAQNGNMDLVKLLLTHGAIPNCQESPYLLHASVHLGRSELIRLLVDLDPNIDFKKPAYADALQLACTAGDSVAVECLTRAGADLTMNGENMSASAPLVMDEDSLTVRYHGKDDDSYRVAAAVRANHPIPLLYLNFYFEITVIDDGDTGEIGLGVCSGYTTLDVLPGRFVSSWGYHGDDAKLYEASDQGKPYGERYGTGDVVGCLVTPERDIIFTKNGTSLGRNQPSSHILRVLELMQIFQGIAARAPPGKLYAVVGMKSYGAAIRANFGQEPFLYRVRAV